MKYSLMYVIRFLLSFTVLCVLLWILRSYLNFTALRPSEMYHKPWAASFTLYKLATIFLQLVAKRRPEDFFNFEPWWSILNYELWSMNPVICWVFSFFLLFFFCNCCTNYNDYNNKKILPTSWKQQQQKIMKSFVWLVCRLVGLVMSCEKPLQRAAFGFCWACARSLISGNWVTVFLYMNSLLWTIRIVLFLVNIKHQELDKEKRTPGTGVTADCVEMTVNKLPSWIKHMLKNLPGNQPSTVSSKWWIPDDLFWIQDDSFCV